MAWAGKTQAIATNIARSGRNLILGFIRMDFMTSPTRTALLLRTMGPKPIICGSFFFKGVGKSMSLGASGYNPPTGDRALSAVIELCLTCMK